MGPGNEAILGTQVQCKCPHKQDQEDDHEEAASLTHVEAANLPSEQRTAEENHQGRNGTNRACLYGR